MKDPAKPIEKVLEGSLKTPVGDRILMIGGVLFVAALFAHYILGIGRLSPEKSHESES